MKQDFLDAVSSLVGRLMEDSIHTSAPSKVGKVENNLQSLPRTSR